MKTYRQRYICIAGELFCIISIETLNNGDLKRNYAYKLIP